MSDKQKKANPSPSGGGSRTRKKTSPSARPLPTLGALGAQSGHVHQSEPSVAELAEMVAAERMVIEELQGCETGRCSELVAHERTLRLLTEELRRRTSAPGPAAP